MRVSGRVRVMNSSAVVVCLSPEQNSASCDYYCTETRGKDNDGNPSKLCMHGEFGVCWNEEVVREVKINYVLENL